MSKNIKDLSKSELISFIVNNMYDFSMNHKMGCSCCGDIDDDWYYVCDDCNEE